jgi:hypothetical protein
MIPSHPVSTLLIWLLLVGGFAYVYWYANRRYVRSIQAWATLNNYEVVCKRLRIPWSGDRRVWIDMKAPGGQSCVVGLEVRGYLRGAYFPIGKLIDVHYLDGHSSDSIHKQA